MNIIKLILAVLGLIFGVMLFFWLFGLITSLLWYGFVIGLLGGGRIRRLQAFSQRLKTKYVGSGPATRLHRRSRFNMSWDEYEQKYLTK